MLLQLIIAISLAGLAAADSDPKEFVSAVNTPPATVTAGKPTTVQLKFRVHEGFHVNSNVPHSSYLIPTKLSLSPPAEIKVGKISYPAGTDMSLPFAPDEKLNVYSGEFTIAASVSAASTAAQGPHKIQGELSYQACNDRACYPPKKLPVSIEVNVAKAKLSSPAGKKQSTTTAR